MKYLLYDLGMAKAVDVAEISLGYAANVSVLNGANYELYKTGAPCRFTGGYIERSPYKVTIQEDGRWYVIIDSGSFFAKIKALVKLRPSEKELAAGRSVSDIEPEIHELFAKKAEKTKKADAATVLLKSNSRLFLPHYYKDRAGAALPLADALTAAGVTVFYEDFTLEPGDDLAGKIKDGLAKYKFGALIFSRAMIRAGWRSADVRYLREQLSSDYRSLYPVWHNVAKTDLLNHLPELAEFAPVSAGSRDAAAVAEEIIETIWL
jgi:hypothetical protein